MKKILLLFFVFLASLSWSQDIQIPGVGGIHVLVRSGLWNGSGSSGVNNNYIFTPNLASTGICLSVQNEDAGSHALTVNLYTTADPNVVTFAVPARWSLVSYPNSSWTISGGSNFTTYVPLTTAGRGLVRIVGGTGAGTATIIATETQQQNCGSTGSIVTGCPFIANATVATATTSLLVTGVNTTGIYVCSYSVTVGGATVAAVKNLFVQGTGGTCGGSTVTLWPLQTGTTTAQQFQLSAGYGYLFSVVSGLNLCYTDAGTTAGSVVTINYASF